MICTCINYQSESVWGSLLGADCYNTIGGWWADLVLASWSLALTPWRSSCMVLGSLSLWLLVVASWFLAPVPWLLVLAWLLVPGSARMGIWLLRGLLGSAFLALVSMAPAWSLSPSPWLLLLGSWPCIAFQQLAANTSHFTLFAFWWWILNSESWFIEHHCIYPSWALIFMVQLKITFYSCMHQQAPALKWCGLHL